MIISWVSRSSDNFALGEVLGMLGDAWCNLVEPGWGAKKTQHFWSSTESKKPNSDRVAKTNSDQRLRWQALSAGTTFIKQRCLGVECSAFWGIPCIITSTTACIRWGELKGVGWLCIFLQKNGWTITPLAPWPCSSWRRAVLFHTRGELCCLNRTYFVLQLYHLELLRACFCFMPNLWTNG